MRPGRGPDGAERNFEAASSLQIPDGVQDLPFFTAIDMAVRSSVISVSRRRRPALRLRSATLSRS